MCDVSFHFFLCDSYGQMKQPGFTVCLLCAQNWAGESDDREPWAVQPLPSRDEQGDEHWSWEVWLKTPALSGHGLAHCTLKCLWSRPGFLSLHISWGLAQSAVFSRPEPLHTAVPTSATPAGQVRNDGPLAQPQPWVSSLTPCLATHCPLFPTPLHFHFILPFHSLDLDLTCTTINFSFIKSWLQARHCARYFLFAASNPHSNYGKEETWGPYFINMAMEAGTRLRKWPEVTAGTLSLRA